MKTVAIIPARGGSKEIPSKNITLFNKKPLIAWAIIRALESKNINRVIVSTDSPTIAKVAKKYGAEVPFLRPKSLAGATIGIEPALRHAYGWLLKNEDYKADCIVLLMPTNPLRQTYHIDRAFRIFRTSKVDSVVSVGETPANHTPYWTLIKDPSGKVQLFGGKNLKNILTRRQDFPQKCYARNDIVYILKPENLFEKKPSLYGDSVELLKISPLYEIDLNTKEEWLDAEIKFRRLKRLKKWSGI